MNNLALFDFDGTITNKDTFIEFIKYSVGYTKFILGFMFLSPIFFLYKLKIIPNYKVKEIVLGLFFKGLSSKKFQLYATAYSLKCINKIVKPEAIEKINWHKTRGDKIIIVSASIECWLKPWCTKNNLELLSTKLKVKDFVITGKLLTKNCYGIEKVNQIKENYNLDEYKVIYVYGDTKGDKEMLELTTQDKRFYRCF